jgi:hypothetical protein
VHTLQSIEIRVDFYEIFAVFNVGGRRENQELVATRWALSPTTGDLIGDLARCSAPMTTIPEPQRLPKFLILGLTQCPSVFLSLALRLDDMRKINVKDIAEESSTSPKGKFGGASKEISVAFGPTAAPGN